MEGVGGARTGSSTAPLSHHQWVYLKKVVKMEREGGRGRKGLGCFPPPLISLFSKVFLAAPQCFHSSFYRAGVETRCGRCSSAVAVAVAQQNVKQNKVQQQQRRLVSEASAQGCFFSFCCFPGPDSGSTAGQGSGSGLSPASVHHLIRVPELIG